MKEYSTVEAREQFSEIINQAAYGKEPVVLMRRKKPLAVIISLEEYKRKFEE